MPFVKGQSGNPGGRPKGFGELIREKTRDGAEMVSLALKVMRGKLSVVQFDKDGKPHDAGPSVKERLDALKWLADRGFGKVPDVALATAFTDEELIAELSRRRDTKRGDVAGNRGSALNS